MNLTIDLPVTAKGDKPSFELVQLLAALQATIKAQGELIAALTERVEALETP